jgi:hypothetical protein
LHLPSAISRPIVPDAPIDAILQPFGRQTDWGLVGIFVVPSYCQHSRHAQMPRRRSVPLAFRFTFTRRLDFRYSSRPAGPAWGDGARRLARIATAPSPA